MERIAVEFRALPRGIAWSIAGKPGAGEVLPVVIPAGFTATAERAIAKARVAPANLARFTVSVNGAQTSMLVTFNSGSVTGLVSGEAVFADGDFVTLTAPAPADAALADISIALRR